MGSTWGATVCSVRCGAAQGPHARQACRSPHRHAPAQPCSGNANCPAPLPPACHLHHTRRRPNHTHAPSLQPAPTPTPSPLQLAEKRKSGFQEVVALILQAVDALPEPSFADFVVMSGHELERGEEVRRGGAGEGVGREESYDTSVVCCVVTGRQLPRHHGGQPAGLCLCTAPHIAASFLRPPLAHIPLPALLAPYPGPRSHLERMAYPCPIILMALVQTTPRPYTPPPPPPPHPRSCPSTCCGPARCPATPRRCAAVPTTTC